jgi:hypothetical protein
MIRGDSLVEDNRPACDYRQVRRTRGDHQAISEQLLFELQMMFLMADRLRRHLSGEFVLPDDIKTACIESLVIHVRSLEEFIWGDPQDGHPHDALASDFFADGEWEETRKRIQSSSLRKVAVRAGREVAHLSYRRLGMTEEARRWQFDVIPCVIGVALRLFLDGASREDLCEGFERRLREVWPEHLDFPIAISFPPNCDTAPAVTIATKPFDDLSEFRRASFEEMLNASLAQVAPVKAQRSSQAVAT